MFGFALFLMLLATGYVVAHAWSITVTRALEAGGRLRGRGTVIWFAGPLVVLSLCAAMVIVRAGQRLAGLDPLNPDVMLGWDAAAVGAITVMVSSLVGWATARFAKWLPPRRRGRPPIAVLQTVAPVLTWLSSLIIPVMAAGFAAAFIVGWRANPPQGWDFLLIPLVVALTFWLISHYGGMGRRMLHDAAEQWSGPQDAGEPLVLYLRPFDEERTLFVPGRTLEEFLGPDIRARLGEFVGLGSPQDRLPPPGGARRIYREDETWQDAFEELARTSGCIVAAAASSANTSWELARIRELGLHSKLFLVFPPHREVRQASPLWGSAPWWRVAGAVANAYLDDDTDRLTTILARGGTPRALSAVNPVAWADLVDELTELGYAVPVGDPGPGTVMGFDDAGTAMLVARSATRPGEFVDPMIARLAKAPGRQDRANG